MGWFDEPLDVDLTLLQKKGILKKSLEKEKGAGNLKQDSDGYVDISAIGNSNNSDSVQNNAPESSGSVGSGFDFLNSLAGVGNSGVSSSSAEKSSYYGTESAVQGTEEKDLVIQGLKNKIEDLEYKINDLVDRLVKLEGRTI